MAAFENLLYLGTRSTVLSTFAVHKLMPRCWYRLRGRDGAHATFFIASLLAGLTSKAVGDMHRRGVPPGPVQDLDFCFALFCVGSPLSGPTPCNTVFSR